MRSMRCSCCDGETCMDGGLLAFFFCFWFCCFCDSMHSDTLGFLFSFLMHCFPRLLFSIVCSVLVLLAV
jgi:hypothetical protein